MEPEYRQSISTHLRWSYLISSTLPLLIVGTLLIVLNFRAQQRMVYNDQSYRANQVARDVSTYISGIEAQILQFGQSVVRDTSTPQLQLHVNSINTLALRELFVVEANGRVIVHFAQNNIFPSAGTINHLDDPQIVSALAGRGVRSDLERTDDGQVVFTSILPVREQSEVVGAISAEIDATPIEQVLRPLDVHTDMVTYLMNERYEVMLSNGPSAGTTPTSLDPLFRIGTEIAQYDGGDGLRVVGARASITPSNWWIVVEQPASVAFATVQRSVMLLAMLVTVVGLFALGVGLWQAQKIVRPLQVLRTGAFQLGAGQLDHRIDIAGTDEMGQLAQTFNQMAEHLQASRAEIELQNDHLRNGLALARDIQIGLLPTTPPWNHNMLSVQARSLPAYEVGGDFYTYLNLPNDRAAIAVGDISGKGVAAALLMALTSSMVESHIRTIETPSEAFTILNDLLSPRLKLNRMNAALIYAIFDLQAQTMTVANAGMIAPYLIRTTATQNGHTPPSTPSVSCALIDVGGLPIGSLPLAHYQDVTVTLVPNDIILFVSDGVVEARNETGELFGFERLQDVMTTAPDSHDTTLLIARILHAVQEFVGQTDQHDDLTIVAVRPTFLRTTFPDHASDETIQAVPLQAS